MVKPTQGARAVLHLGAGQKGKRGPKPRRALRSDTDLGGWRREGGRSGQSLGNMLGFAGDGDSFKKRQGLWRGNCSGAKSKTADLPLV